MDWTVIFSAIAAFGVVLTGTGTFFNGVAALNLSRGQRVVAAKVDGLADHVAEVKTIATAVAKQTDGVTEKLVALTDTAAHARGMKDQLDETTAAEKEVRTP